MIKNEAVAFSTPLTRKEVAMTIIEYEDKKVELDDKEYLVNFEEWNRNVACA